MSEYGIRIKNFEAASVYEYKYGFRNNLDQTNAMLVNSLFLDYLLDNKLIRLHKEESTRDIICIEFGYGTKDYKTALSKIKALELKPDLQEKTKESILKIKESLEKNKQYCIKISKDDLRVRFYTEGLSITYRTYDKDGNEIIDKQETISYKMLYRTPGKAKKGTCMFVNADIYDEVHNFLYMGIKLPKKNAPIVEVGAYSSLITSSIIGRVQILPEQILIVNDVDSLWETKVLTVGIDNKKQCTIEEKEKYQVSNTMFDGQALIDSSIFPSYGDGYVLLRHHMTKVAAFNTNIQLFMKDKFGDNYENATVRDMFGRSVRVKDIRLITTDNAIKWLKFNVSFETWASWLKKNDYQFGVVKTSHPSKLGDVQRMSYQMMNALNIDSMDSVCSKTVEYIKALKESETTFFDYLDKNKNFANDYEVLLALINHNKDFVRSSYFRRRRSDIISAYLLDFKSGHGIQNADNLTIVGSPYAMLLHAIGESPFDDPTFESEAGCIQCYTGRFGNNEYLAEFRNPFNSRNNLGYLHNVYHEYFGKYFNFGKLIVAVNMNKTDFQDRNNGSDQDSDSIYITNQTDIVEHAKYCYQNYPTIVNKIPKDKNIYDYDMKSFAEVDNKLAAAQLAIGESSNLAQLCLTYTYNFDDRKYYEYVCILSVLAQVAIDNAKRKFDIDLNKEIARIKADMDIDRNGLPQFWIVTKKDKRKARNDKIREERKRQNRKKIKERIREELVCPMNEVYKITIGNIPSSQNTLGMDKFWVKHDNTENWKITKKIESFIKEYSIDLYNYNISDEDEEDNYLLLKQNYEQMIKDLRQLTATRNNVGLFSLLINRAFLITSSQKQNKDALLAKTNKNRALLLKVLYDIDTKSFLKCFRVDLEV